MRWLLIVGLGGCGLWPREPEAPLLVGNGNADMAVLECLAGVPLSTEGIQSNDLVRDAVSQPGAVSFLSYVVSCALPAGASVTVTVRGQEQVLEGSIGLAPDWATAPCNEDCQERVSMCLAARTNLYGLPVSIVMFNELIASPEDAELAAQSLREGAFWGNYFTDPPELYACTGDGVDPLKRAYRACSRPGSPCGIKVVGTCGTFDGSTGTGTTQRACETYDEATASYRDCHDQLSDADGSFPASSRTWRHVMTVNLLPSAFAEPTCDGVDPGISVPDFPSEGGLGDPCRAQADCTEPGLTCDLEWPGGMCTALCTDSEPEPEAEACGQADATCLSIADASPGYCQIACDASAERGEEGACPDAQVCTGWWWHRSPGDDPGCTPWCSTDAQCGAYHECDPRLAVCVPLGRGDNEERLPDGSACSVSARDDYGRSLDCRGDCFFLDSTDVGICASFVDLSVTDACPDEGVRPFEARDDDVGICMLRSCEDASECDDGQTCAPCWLNLSGSCCQ